MEIERVYTHKDHGHIGTVNLTVPDDGWVLDGVPLDSVGVRHLANFALQTLQDAYAGDNRPKDYTGTAADYAVERWMEKLDRILNGKINSRASGPRDPVRTMAITLATLNMTGKTAKIRAGLATALVDSTKPNGYWWDEARAAIERAKNAPPANVAGMVTKTGETVPESAESVGESAVAAAVATE